MPVTVGTLTSNVTVTDTSRRFSDQTLEQIVRLVTARVRRELEAEKVAQEEAQIPDRMSE